MSRGGQGQRLHPRECDWPGNDTARVYCGCDFSNSCFFPCHLEDAGALDDASGTPTVLIVPNSSQQGVLIDVQRPHHGFIVNRVLPGSHIMQISDCARIQCGSDELSSSTAVAGMLSVWTG